MDLITIFSIHSDCICCIYSHRMLKRGAFGYQEAI